MLQRYSQFYQNNLVANVTPYSLKAQEKMSALKHAAMGRGLNPVAADQDSLAMLYGIVKRQAGILAYNRIFFIVGLAFLVIIPFLLLLKRQQHH